MIWLFSILHNLGSWSGLSTHPRHEESHKSSRVRSFNWHDVFILCLVVPLLCLIPALHTFPTDVSRLINSPHYDFFRLLIFYQRLEASCLGVLTFENTYDWRIWTFSPIDAAGFDMVSIYYVLTCIVWLSFTTALPWRLLQPDWRNGPRPKLSRLS